MCLAGFRLLLAPPYIVERSNYVSKKAVGVKQSCSLMSLAAVGGILQNPIPVCSRAMPLAAVQREADGFRALLKEAEVLMTDSCLPHAQFVVATFFTPTLFYLLFLEGKQLKRDGKVHPELPFNPVLSESEWRGQLKDSPVKTVIEITFLSIHGFALLTVSR